MHVEATPHLHDILVVHLFNAGLPCMASAHALDTTRPVASVTHWLPCEAVDSASGLSHRSHLLPTLKTQRSLWGRLCSLHSKTLPSHNPRERGTGMERYGTGSGTKRPTPAQHCHHAAHLYQNSQFGARIAQQAILRLPAGSSQAHLYNQTPQLCHSLQQL